jgi:pyridoxal 5'-phosphate synthase pdxT subunit
LVSTGLAGSALRRPAGAARATVGVLALQGDVREHARLLGTLGAGVVAIRRPEQLAGVSALVLPGGESTTMSMLLASAGLFEPIAARIGTGMPVLGTCAGMILLAREILDGRADQRTFGAIDLVVRRNAFGRQVESFEADLPLDGLPGGPLHAVFIRAPYVERAGPDVEVLATAGGRPVLCRHGRVTAAAFHPELAGDTRLHELLLSDAEGD